MNNRKSGSTTIVEIVCAIIFVIFTIYYVYSFQGDILGMMQYAWSDHETHYNRLIGGSIIFFVLMIITYLTSLLFSFQNRFKALVYMPSILIMAQTTAVNVDDVGNVFMSWQTAWITILLIALYPLIIKWMNKIHVLSLLPLDAEAALQWLSNGIIMVILVVLAYSIGNTDRNLHNRLAIERLCHEDLFAEALAEGIPQFDHGSGITMWRAYALANQEKNDSVEMTMLGESLFKYNIDGNNPYILPRKGKEPHALLYDCYPIWQTIGFIPKDINEDPVIYLKREIERHKAHLAAKDYLLCTYLLRKDLNSFRHELPQYYDENKSLPQHYKEALTIYYASPSHQAEMSRDSVNIDNAMFEDYSDFQNMLHANSSNIVKQSNLRDNYFGTYWYYYYRKSK